MQTSVLLSIKPEFVTRIFEGTKQFEFRRRLFANRDIKTIVVYATAPVSKVIGEFEIEDILELEIDELWEKTKEYSGIQKEYFEAYFVGLETGYAIKIGETYKYEFPLELKADFNVKNAPQSFVYVDH
jgi:predicted transcriptional regulator